MAISGQEMEDACGRVHKFADQICGGFSPAEMHFMFAALAATYLEMFSKEIDKRDILRRS